MKNDEIIINFKNSKFFNRILNSYDVVFISLGGSRLCNAEIDSSDYDIIVYVMDKIDFDPVGGLIHTYDIKNHPGIHLHYNVFSLYDIFLPSNFFRYGGLAKVTLFSDNYFLYKNPKYENLINNIFNDKNIIQNMIKISAYGLESYISDEYLGYLKENNKFIKRMFNKYLYGMALSFMQLLGKDIDYEIIKKLRSGDIFNENEKDQEINRKSTELFLDTVSYINSHPINIEKVKQESQEYLNKKYLLKEDYKNEK